MSNEDKSRRGRSNTHRPLLQDNLTSKDYYYDAYAHYKTHEELLKDTVRTETYMTAIYNSKHLFKDKIVLDVGCGTGILSLFAAKAGAKQVLGVESSSIVEQAKEIVENNNLDSVISIIRGKIEEVKLPVEKVDIIVSDWMGYSVLHGCLLESVLFARDKWLVEGGLMFPDRVTLYVSAMHDYNKEMKFDYWNDVYGFNMSRIKEISIAEPYIRLVYPEYVVTNKCLVKEIDVLNIKKEDIEFANPFQLQVKKDDYIEALLTYFDVEFTVCPKKIWFSTGPDWLTHWKQTRFYLCDQITCKKGEDVYGLIRMFWKSGKKNELDVEITVDFDGELSQLHETNRYKML